MSENATLNVDPLRRPALWVGLVAMLFTGIGLFASPEQAFSAYLAAWMFWLGTALGMMALLMLHALIGGRWGEVLRPVALAGTGTVPLMLLLGVPLLFGLEHLYDWAVPERVAADPMLAAKQPWLSEPWFIARLLIYAAVWLALSWLLRRWTLTGRFTPLARLSAIGLLLYIVTVSFAAFDLLMSLEPRWYSTVFGLLTASTQWVGGIAAVLVVMWQLRARAGVFGAITRQDSDRLARLLLTLLLVWAYLSFTQYLMVWYVEQPEQLGRYLERFRGGWQWFGVVVIVFQLVIPFILLLSRAARQRLPAAGGIAALVLLANAGYLYWLTVPFIREQIGLHWMDPAALLGIGGLWMWLMLLNLERLPDPILATEPLPRH